MLSKLSVKVLKTSEVSGLVKLSSVSQDKTNQMYEEASENGIYDVA